MLPALVRTANAVERQAWLARVVERGGLDATAAREELGRALSGRPANGESKVGVAAAASRPALPRAETLLPAERWLLALIARGAAGVETALGELDEEDLAALRAAPLVARRGDVVTLTSVAAAIEDEEARRLLTQIAVLGVPEQGLAAGDCVRELRRQPLRARMDEIQRQLAKVSGEAQDALLEEKMRLRRQMAGL